jgi:hypothetical protein
LEAEEEFPKKTEAEYKGIWLQLVGSEATRPKRLQHPAITELLDEFNVIFQEPSGLPIPRSFDHKIPLTEGAQPTCVRPY